MYAHDRAAVSASTKDEESGVVPPGYTLHGGMCGWGVPESHQTDLCFPSVCGMEEERLQKNMVVAV